MSKRRNLTLGFAILACAVLASGCTSYYKVADPQTGTVYYTQSLERESGGAVTLKDGKTNGEVTIQNSNVTSISKEQFEANRMRSGENPEAEARAAQARAAEAAAAAEAQMAAAKAAAAKEAASPERLRENLVTAKDQIDKSLAALSEVADPAQTDLKGAYARYSAQVDALKAQSQTIKGQADAMRQARQAYFAQWDQRIASINDPTLRSGAEAKRARLRAAQEKITTDSAAARDAYDPFITDLQSAQKFLSG